MELSDDFATVTYNTVRILRDYPETRSSDLILLRRYYQKYFSIDVPFDKLTSPASIIRCRRHIQKINPDFKGDIKIEMFRDAHSIRYREHYGRTRGGIEL